MLADSDADARRTETAILGDIARLNTSLSTWAPDSEISRWIAKIVELLRSQHKVRGAVDVFRIEADEIPISFKGPGYHADATMTRADGRDEISQNLEGVVTVMNDLHKGNNTGRA